MTGAMIKILPDENMRCEIRVKRPNITPGYPGNETKTAAEFDSEGNFITGDAMRSADPDAINKGLKSEDFKPMSATWVRAANLRLEKPDHLDGSACDIGVTGADRRDIGMRIFPNAAALSAQGLVPTEQHGALLGDDLFREIGHRLADCFRPVSGPASRAARALVMAEPPSTSDSEITAKGNHNCRVILGRRAALLERLYDNVDPATIAIRGKT